MSDKIFISYRREESRRSARILYDRLCARFDRKQIFMDIDAIALDDDFVKGIEKTVAECDVLIALIGEHWLTSTDERGSRRLENPEDFVRIEIATALERGIRVIPVLVDGALMPPPTELPDDLKPLVRRNALQVSDTRFDDDCERLIGTIERVFENTKAEQSGSKELKERLDHKPHSALPGEIAVNDIFISCKNLNADGIQTRDAEIAAEVYDFLTGKGLSVFLSTFSLEELGASDYTSAIDSALESASVLLAYPSY